MRARFWNTECASGHSLNAFTKAYKDWCGQNGYRGQDNKAEEIYLLAKESILPLIKNNYTIVIILQAARELTNTCISLVEIQQK